MLLLWLWFVRWGLIARYWRFWWSYISRAFIRMKKVGTSEICRLVRSCTLHQVLNGIARQKYIILSSWIGFDRRFLSQLTLIIRGCVPLLQLLLRWLRCRVFRVRFAWWSQTRCAFVLIKREREGNEDRFLSLQLISSFLYFANKI
jgi:hypothetical protein